jgi:hypothetical protein
VSLDVELDEGFAAAVPATLTARAATAATAKTIAIERFIVRLLVGFTHPVRGLASRNRAFLLKGRA